MNWRSIRAVGAGLLVVVVTTTLVDVALHVARVYPTGRPLDDALASLASSYRLVIGIGGAWLTARLAPHAPMRHALVLGAIGGILALLGLIATWKLDLGPGWYPVSLVVLALPQSWVGGRLCEAQARRRD